MPEAFRGWFIATHLVSGFWFPAGFPKNGSQWLRDQGIDIEPSETSEFWVNKKPSSWTGVTGIWKDIFLGKHTKSYWKWPFISFYIHVVRWFTHVAEGEVSIKAVEHGHVYPFIYSWFSQNEWIFHTFLYVCQRVPHLFLDVTPIVYGLLYGSYTTDGQANWLLYEPLDVYQVVFFPCVDVLWVSL
jgi:hypothetical protein